MNAPVRTFDAKPAVRGNDPLSIGMIGPPGGGKTYSALRVARGMQTVRGGDIVLIDTEGGRARKYADEFKFLHVDFEPPHQPHAFLEAIEAQIARQPACIIVDSASDEHEGKGGYLEWHDEMVPRMSGNEWAAWAKPKASRKRLITGMLHIRVPLIFTFRAREKTKQQQGDRGKKEIINIGWMPVAPLEIVHSLDLTCILPPRADGVPVWESTKIGEDFIIKLPNFLAPLIEKGALNENTGRALAEWARGSVPPHPTHKDQGGAVDQPEPVHSHPTGSGAVAQPSPRPSPRAGDPPPAASPTHPTAAGGAVLSLADEAREAARKGPAAFKTFWSNLEVHERNELTPLGEELRWLMNEAAV